MKRMIIAFCLAGAACCAPTGTSLAQPGEWGFGRLERFGPARGTLTPPNPLVDSLVAYYGLEEASGTRYDGHGTNHLTAYNNPGDTVGVIGRAATFDNTLGQYLQSASPNMAVMQGDWSVMFWAKVGNPGGSEARVLVSRGTGLACNSMEYLLFTQSGSHVVRACDGTTRQVVSSAGISWTHIAVRFNHSVDSLYLAINGAHVAKAYVPNAILQVPPFSIGATGIGTYPFYGVVDELYFWRGYHIPDHFINWYYNTGIGRSFVELMTY